MSTSLLEIVGISKEYPGVRAVTDASFSLERGEILGLVGKNGAGKSTVIKILAGVVQPDGGELIIDGEVKTIERPHDATVLGLSFVHQEFAIVPGLSVAENVLLGLNYPKLPGRIINKSKLNATAKNILESLGMEKIDPEAELGSLSLAMQRMVMLARGLAANARVLVLDEPTASLTAEEVAHLFAMVRKLAKLGTSVIYVTHRLDEIFELTDRVLVMRDGRVEFNGPTQGLTKTQLIEHILGDASGTDVNDRRVQKGIDSSGGDVEAVSVVGMRREGVIKDVSFTAKRGEILGIAGLVGAGRTELARLIFGADKKDSGNVIVDGKEVKIKNPRDAMDAGIVLLPEDRRHQGLIMEFDIRENVTLASLKNNRRRSWLPIPKRSVEVSVAKKSISELGIKTSNYKNPAQWLSGGNQQKLVLAKWLQRSASVFIFDEPTHGIDVGAKEEIYLLMEKLASENKAVIFISSEFPELVGVCNRVIVLSEGRLIGELSGSDVSEVKMLELCYNLH
jgi:ABC-type sugar transport system ATPase subunit